MDLIWEAAHAGTCYPRSAKAALNYFREALESLPPGETAPPPTSNPLAWIVPHIDFRVDLTTYADVYRRIVSRGAFPETVYILGVGHRCPHDFSLCPGTFRTPLGEVGSHLPVIREISRASRLDAARSPESYEGEHSLEFVVIWLQALRDLYFPGQVFQVVPVLLGGLPEHVIAAKSPGPRTTFSRFGRALVESFQQRAATSMMVASIDGCHVGPRFDHEFPSRRTDPPDCLEMGGPTLEYVHQPDAGGLLPATRTDPEWVLLRWRGCAHPAPAKPSPRIPAVLPQAMV